MSVQEFGERLRQMIAGQLPVKDDYNEFVGHADVLRQLLEVAPDAIRADLQFLHDLMANARDARGAQVLGIFPALNLRYANCRGRYRSNYDPDCFMLREEYRPLRPVGRKRASTS